MSAENVETLRAGYAVFNAGDYEGVLRYFHEEIEWIPYLGALQGSIYHGHEELLAMWNDIRESFGGEFEVVADEFVDCGEKVAVSVSAHAVGPGSGIVLDQSWAHLASFKDGLVVRIEPLPTLEEAVEAGGGPA